MEPIIRFWSRQAGGPSNVADDLEAGDAVSEAWTREQAERLASPSPGSWTIDFVRFRERPDPSSSAGMVRDACTDQGD
jgi:hypothetical protein